MSGLLARPGYRAAAQGDLPERRLRITAVLADQSARRRFFAAGEECVEVGTAVP
ncbi:MAG: hypothetical protein ACRDG7_16075 [Candidatus Limnocylindria bacterium]